MKRFTALLVVAVALAPTMIATEPVGAAGLLTCNLAANTTIEPGEAAGTFDWTISGGGTCTGNQSTFIVQLESVGQSTGLGLCTSSDVRHLELASVLTMTATTTGQTQTLALEIGAPSTTYPFTTPFGITGSGGSVGAGTLFTRIFLACPPAGTPSTAIYFTLAR